MTQKGTTGLEPVYQVRHFDRALDLLNALSPWDALWQGTGGINGWLFRGQRDADWKLSPSAMRKDAFPSWQAGAHRYTPQKGDQVEAEKRAIQSFLGACVSSAIPIPEDSQWLRSEVLETIWVNELFDIIFPPALQRSIYALAQHHGVPTRLLDWTQLPLVGAYFACHEIARALALNATLPTGSDRCAVFALRQAIAFTRLAKNDKKRDKEPEPELVQVTAPYEANPNLRAQRGTFSLVMYRGSTPDGILPTVEDLIKTWVDSWPDQRPQETELMLVKFTLPHAECRRLLSLLSQANVHAGTVFPDYDGAVRSLDEREWHL